MALRPETAGLLAGFEKRMKFINIVRFLLEYKYPDRVRSMIPDKKILDNIVLAVLVYIKDRTLGSEQRCTIADVDQFLEDIAVILPDSCEINTAELARYIVVDVLQCGGVLNEFLTFDSVTESFKMMPVRLLNEEKGSYHLTDDAFDFLFRSKEIESELDYSVTRFKMKEYLKRNNYEDALDASRELVSRILNMKISMDDFILRCRENISRVTVDQYDTVITKTRTLLENEYKELREIQSSAEERERVLEQAQASGLDIGETQKQRRALREMIRNITRTIEEQRVLINKKTTLSESYEELIRDQFAMNHFERLNFEQDIMSPLRKKGAPLGDAANFLLFMLTKPCFENQFSVENFYAPQTKIVQQEEDAGIDLTAEELDGVQKAEARNARNRAIVQCFFEFAGGRSKFKISEFTQSLRLSELSSFCTENALPNILLSMCSMQKLDLDAWKQSEPFYAVPNGEFELAWCLTEIPEQLLQIHNITFTKLKTSFCYVAQINDAKQKIEMSDFDVEVTA